METDPVSDSDEQLLAVLARLEECRSALAACGNRDSAHLVSVAALDVRMKLNRIGDAELKLLCEAMAAKEVAEGGPQGTKPSHTERSLRNEKSLRDTQPSYETKPSSGGMPSQETTSPEETSRRPLLRVVK